MSLRIGRPAAVFAAILIAVSGSAAASASPEAVGSAAARGNAVDRAFVREMIPHHRMAVEMAEMATKQAEHMKITKFARGIISTQDSEIRRMRPIARRLKVKPAPIQDHQVMMKDADTLGLSMDDMGMSMDMQALMNAKPFDRAFIDAMIPHHQGAIRMARAELAKGTNSQLRTIARAIVSGQTKEIRELNTWRRTWYGATSPAGGVPNA